VEKRGENGPYSTYDGANSRVKVVRGGDLVRRKGRRNKREGKWFTSKKKGTLGEGGGQKAIT